MLHCVSVLMCVRVCLLGVKFQSCGRALNGGMEQMWRLCHNIYPGWVPNGTAWRPAAAPIGRQLATLVLDLQNNHAATLPASPLLWWQRAGRMCRLADPPSLSHSLHSLKFSLIIWSHYPLIFFLWKIFKICKHFLVLWHCWSNPRRLFSLCIYLHLIG